MRYLLKSRLALFRASPTFELLTAFRALSTMSRDLNKIVSTYKELTKVPSVSSGRIGENCVSLAWAQRNIEEGKTTTFLIQHIIDNNTFKPIVETSPVDISNEILAAYSPSEKYRAVLKNGNTKDKKEILEIWSKQNLYRSVDLTALDIHGSVYSDVEFQSFNWSSDESKLLYIAEKKKKKSEPFYKRKAPKEDEGDQEEIVGNEYVYEDDWGEQLVGKKKSVICIYDISEDTVSILDGIPQDVCPCKIIWSPDDSYLIGIALKTFPRKLGLIYCSNRNSTIFTLDMEGNYAELNLENKCVKSPRLTPDGKNLIWLQREAGGPHASCMQLCKIPLPICNSNTPEIIIDIVPRSATTTNGSQFYGLYNTGFLKRCWTKDGRLVVNTPGKAYTQIYVINLDKKTVTEIPYANGSQNVLDVKDDVILINRKSFFTPDQVFIGKLEADGKEHQTTFTTVTKPVEVPLFKNYHSVCFDLKYNNTDSVDEFSAIYVGPSSGEEKSVPLIVWPHGGPHSVINVGYYLEYAFLVSMGYSILCVNYRGSLGFGEDNVHFLKGKVGTTDVSDCVMATKEALSKFTWLNPNRVMLCGGSHGGFLVTHLSGQYPDMYRAVVSRNPVIDIASMSVISDIPDWCYFEAGSDYTFIKNPDSKLLAKMRESSPIMHVNKVKAPTLLQIGSKDLRVPPSQGIEFYHSLKANGVKTKLNLYDDNHPLGNLPNEMDNLINTLLWFEENAN